MKLRIKSIVLAIMLSGIILALLLPGCAKVPAPAPSVPQKPEQPVETEQTQGTSQAKTETPPIVIPPWYKTSFSTGKPSYLPVEEITAERTWKSLVNFPVTIKPFPYGVNIWNAEQAGNADAGLVFSTPPGKGEYTLKPGETLKQEVKWDQRGRGGKTVEPGIYCVTFEYLQNTKVFQGYGNNIVIQFPQGAIDKRIALELDKQLQDGSRLVLKDLVLSSKGFSKLNAVVFPTDYDGPAADFERPLFGNATMSIHYSLDNGPLKSLLFEYGGFWKDYVEFNWKLINPIPRDTKSITFTVDRVKLELTPQKQPQTEREWKGPFVFQVG